MVSLIVKFGILTPVVEKNPSALFSAQSHAHDNSLPLNADLCERRELLSGTFMAAQVRRASHVGGTMIVFAKNSQCILCGETNMKGSWKDQ
jgi:hypothetical protein